MSDARRILQLGTLLQDVGELIALASSSAAAARDRGLLGANWLHAFVDVGLPEGVADMANARHSGDWAEIRKRNLSLLAHHAGRWAAGGVIPPAHGREPAADGPRYLESIFSSMGGTPAMVSADTDSALAYPTPGPRYVDGTAQVAAFGEVFRRWVQAGCIPDALMTILERYWSALPSMASVQPGAGAVPLFDAARLTCALASALYERFSAAGADLGGEPLPELAVEALPDDEPYFAFVAGRLFGGESFVERMIARGDVCTWLGRAFFVRLLSQHVADHVLSRLGLCSANALCRTDTEFMLLCPNVPALKEAADAAEARVNRWLFDTYGPAMHWGIGIVPAAGRDMSGGSFAGILAALDRSVEEQGALPHRAALAHVLKQQDPANADASCEVCGSDSDPNLGSLSPRTPDVKACARCQSLTHVGASLMGAIGVSSDAVADEARASAPEPALLCLPKSDGAWVRYEVVKGDAAPGSVALRYVFADVALTSHAAGQAGSIFFARHIRSSAHLPKSGRTGDKKRRHEAASLRALAKSARGASWLGMLRMDVDETLARVWGQAADLPRFATASRLIARFFDVHVPAICGARLPEGLQPRDVSEKRPAQANGRNVTLIRSAGDDLLLVGAWDEVAEVALDIRECFRLYTASGALTASAAVTAGESGSTLMNLSRDCVQGLAAAKATGGNRCALFHDPTALARPQAAAGRGHVCHTWEQLQTLVVASVQSLKMTGRMVQNRFEAHLPHAFTRRLLGLAEQWERGDEFYLPRLARMARQLREGTRGDVSAAQRLLTDASKMPGLRAACVWLTLLSGKA